MTLAAPPPVNWCLDIDISRAEVIHLPATGPVVISGDVHPPGLLVSSDGRTVRGYRRMPLQPRPSEMYAAVPSEEGIDVSGNENHLRRVRKTEEP